MFQPPPGYEAPPDDGVVLLDQVRRQRQHLVLDHLGHDDDERERPAVFDWKGGNQRRTSSAWHGAKSRVAILGGSDPRAFKLWRCLSTLPSRIKNFKDYFLIFNFE